MVKLDSSAFGPTRLWMLYELYLSIIHRSPNTIQVREALAVAVVMNATHLAPTTFLWQRCVVSEVKSARLPIETSNREEPNGGSSAVGLRSRPIN